MPKYDARCKDCDNLFEEERPWQADVADCPSCGSTNTRTVWTRVLLLDKAKDPYDYLDGPIPSSRQIKSFGNDRRKGGKDTT